MQENEMFKRSAEFQDLFKITSFCIAHCKTMNKSNLTVHQSQCLQNCGFNRAFIGAHFKKILDGTMQQSIQSFPVQQE